MTEPLPTIREHIHEMEPYQPVQPFEVLSRSLRIPSEEIIKLDANENPYGPIASVLEALAALPYVHIYPDPESRPLRQAIADHTGVPVDNLLAGAGADELIDLVMRLFIEPGDAILDFPPTFGMYAFSGCINGGRLVNVPRLPDFSIDMEKLKGSISCHHPKLMFLATPNNPDGSLIPAHELDQILRLPITVVLDEAYIDFAQTGESRISEVPERENLIVLRTFSKWAALAGLRVGFGAFPTRLMPFLWKIKPPYNISAAASHAAITSLKHADELQAIGAKIVEERDRLINSLTEIQYLKPYPSEANFVLCRVIARDAQALKHDLARRGILVRYFDKPTLKDHIRISVGKPEHTDALLAALRELE